MQSSFKVKSLLFMMCTGLGCSSSSVTDITSPPEEISQNHQPTAMPLRCADALPDGPVGTLSATNIRRGSVALGPCGHVAYTDASGILHLYDPSMRTDVYQAPTPYSIAFSPDGAYFLAHSRTGVVLYDFVQNSVSEYLGYSGGFVALPQDDSATTAGQSLHNMPFVCNDTVLGLIENGQVNNVFGASLGADLSAFQCASMYGADHGPSVTYWDDHHNLHVADFVTRKDRVVPIAFAQRHGVFESADLFQLSGDGRFLVHLPAWNEPSGDTFSLHTDGTAAIVDLATVQVVHHVPAQNFRHGRYEIYMLERSDGGLRMAIAGPTSTMLMKSDESIVFQDYAGVTPVAIMPSEHDVLVRRSSDSALLLASFDSDVLLPVIEASDLNDLTSGGIAVSRDGNVLAISAPPKRCITYPERPEVCHTQIWELVVWSRRDGPMHTYYGTQPLQPEWVGNDGSVLLEGALILGDVPATAPSGFLGTYGLYLFASDGHAMRSLEALSARDVRTVGSALLIEIESFAGRFQSLERWDTITGDASVITDASSYWSEGVVPIAPQFQFWTDARHQRVMFLMTWLDRTTQAEQSALHAGPL